MTIRLSMRSPGMRLDEDPPRLNLEKRRTSGTVRYPTCLRTEFDSKANTISAQHPNSDTRIKIAHGFTDNLTISSPYEPRPSRPTVHPFLSIFSPYSRRDPRWFPGYDLLF